MTGPSELPEKLFYKIGEVSRIVGVEPHVLRYWEKEFATVRPRKSRGGQRLYRRADIDALLRIKELLKDSGFTVVGARKKLLAERRRKDASSTDALQPVPEPIEQPEPEDNRQLLGEIEGLKEENQALRLSRADAAHRFADTQDVLREIRRDLDEIIRELDRLRAKKR